MSSFISVVGEKNTPKSSKSCGCLSNVDVSNFLNGDNRIGGSSCLAAVSGYPSVTVPMGYVSGLPTGLSFIGRAWEDYLIIDLAYAFEQISMVRCPAGNPERFLN